MALVTHVLINFLGRANPAASPIVAAATLPIVLLSMAYSATWFKNLFSKGMLWGYKPDKSSDG